MQIFTKNGKQSSVQSWQTDWELPENAYVVAENADMTNYFEYQGQVDAVLNENDEVISFTMSPDYEPSPEPTQAEKREEAYATQKLIIYTGINGNEIEWTVDEANAYYITYLPELGETALNDLHLMIQQAKQVIREQFPDPVTMSMLPIESGFKMKI